MIWWTLLGCVRTPPTVDGSFSATFGDDDDDTVGGGTGACDPATAGVDCAACDQAGMWATTQGLTGDALVAELNDLTSAHFCNDYGPATTFMFVELDNPDGEVECVYTGHSYPVGNSKPDATVMNTEHTWPQSEGADVFPAECDLHHLYPTESDANSIRANYPFGVVQVATEPLDGGSALGEDADGNTVFEPRDVHKGNVARSMVYFSMRYGYPLTSAQVSLFQDWAAQDPVDQTELDRTLRIADRQGAVNPFVTCPWMIGDL